MIPAPVVKLARIFRKSLKLVCIDSNFAEKMEVNYGKERKKAYRTVNT